MSGCAAGSRNDLRPLTDVRGSVRRLVAVLGFCCALLAYGQTRNGKIVGQVRDERLRPVAGVRVDISLAPAVGAKLKPYLAATLTRSNGMFQIDVPPGVFSVCAALPNSDLLDSCLWNSPVRPNVGIGETVKLEPILLRRGYPLTIRIEDSGSVLANVKALLEKRQVLVGVKLPNGGFAPARLRTKNQTLRIHQVLVPRDTPVSVFVFAKGLRVDDQAGVALDTDKPRRMDVKLSGERSQREFVYMIRGLKP